MYTMHTLYTCKVEECAELPCSQSKRTICLKINPHKHEFQLEPLSAFTQDGTTGPRWVGQVLALDHHSSTLMFPSSSTENTWCLDKASVTPTWKQTRRRLKGHFLKTRFLKEYLKFSFFSYLVSTVSFIFFMFSKCCHHHIQLILKPC